MKTSNCCDAFVNPDLMICSDCKEHCGFVEEEWEKEFEDKFDGWDVNFPTKLVTKFISDTLQKERDKLVGIIYDYRETRYNQEAQDTINDILNLIK